MRAPAEHETERLRLRLFRESDLDAYAAMMADPEVCRYLGDGKPLDRANAWRSMAVMLGHWQLRGYGFWALAPHAWGKGYATEVGRAALQVAFAQGAQKVCSVILPDNQRSIRVAQRLGETFERTVHLVGHDCALYTISSR